MKYTVAYLGHTIKKKVISCARHLVHTTKFFPKKMRLLEILFYMYKNFTFLHQTLN